MKIKIIITALATAAFFIVSPRLSFTFAHPGRTDFSGGHTCRTNCPKWGLGYGEYHYHGGSPVPTPSQPIVQPKPQPQTWIYKGKTYYSFDEANSAFWNDFYTDLDTIYLGSLGRKATEADRNQWNYLASFPTYNILPVVEWVEKSEEYKQYQKAKEKPPEVTNRVFGTSSANEEKETTKEISDKVPDLRVFNLEDNWWLVLLLGLLGWGFISRINKDNG